MPRGSLWDRVGDRRFVDVDLRDRSGAGGRFSSDLSDDELRVRLARAGRAALSSRRT
jgi:hypothetical protein